MKGVWTTWTPGQPGRLRPGAGDPALAHVAPPRRAGASSLPRAYGPSRIVDRKHTPKTGASVEVGRVVGMLALRALSRLLIAPIGLSISRRVVRRQDRAAVCRRPPGVGMSSVRFSVLPNQQRQTAETLNEKAQNL